MTRNLFILHTPFQLYTAQVVVEQYFGGGEHENVLCYEGRTPDEVLQPPLWQQQIELPGLMGVGGASRTTIETGHALIAGMALRAPTRIFVSDIAWPLNNRVFFSPRLTQHCEFAALSDGIATYTCPELSWAQQGKNVAKWVSGLLARTARYTPYRYSMLGLEHPRIRSIYCFRAAMLHDLYQKAVYDIALPSLEERRDKSVALFLDQPYRGFMRAEAWNQIRAATRQWLGGMGFRRLYYKSHPMCDEAYLSDFDGVEMEHVRSTAPAELLFRSLEAGTVVSYTSGALFNLKSLGGDSVRAVAFRPDVFLAVDGSGGRSRRALIDVLRESGVEIS